MMRAGLRAVLLGAAWLLSGCVDLPWKVAGGGSGTEGSNGEIVVGRIFRPDGSPALAASVFVRPENYLVDTLRANLPSVPPDAVTDTGGYFRLDSLAPGAYKVEVRDEKGLAVQLTFDWGRQAQGLILKPDTLRSVSVLVGKVELPEEARGRAFIQVYGLERLVPTDSLGFFTHSNLPAGPHRIRAVSRQPGWSYPAPAVAVVDPGDTARIGSLKAASFADEDYRTWPFSRKIYLNTAAAGVLGRVTDFPLLVRLDESKFDFSLSDGKDIRFSAPDGTKLPYHSDFWDAGRRQGALWVKLDTVNGNNRDQFIIMHWGKRDAPDFSLGKAVFTSFAGEWHLSDDLDNYTHAQFRDASPSAAFGDAFVMPENLGVIGRGAAFRRTHWIRIQVTEAMLPAGALTLSAWVNLFATGNLGAEIVSLGDNYGLRATPEGALKFFLVTDTAGMPAGKPWKACQTGNLDLRNTGWRHVAATYDGKLARVYVDGLVRATCPMEGPLAYPFGREFFMGAHGYYQPGYEFDGSLDEVAAIGSVRSGDWLKLAHENQKPGSILLEFKNGSP